MTVRIATTTVDERTHVQVAGRLESCDVPELDREIRSVVGPFALDLSELVSADDAGLDRLRELAAHGTELGSASHYLQMLLDDDEST